MKSCSMQEIREGVLLIMLLSRYRSKNQHSGEQVFWQTLMTRSLFDMNTEREKQEQQYRIHRKVGERKYSEAPEKVYSSKNGDNIYIKIYKDIYGERTRRRLFKKNRNSQYHSRRLRFCEIEIENHKKRTD